MTRVVIVANRGADMARLEASVSALSTAEIVRRANGRSSVAWMIAADQPSLALIAELSPHQLTVERVREARAAAPDADIVVVAAGAGSRWLADALRAGATAVLPGELGVHALAAVLNEVTAPNPGGALPLARVA
jgi:DNA-binding NarL/FixJ family response regulator